MKRKKLVIVTGASKGIGRAITKKFASQNYNVVAFGRNKNQLLSLSGFVRKSGNTYDYFIGDVSDDIFVNDSVSSIINRYKKIDVLINNAGLAHFEEFTESSLKSFREQIDTNIIGTYNFCKAVVDNMIQNNSGTIVNIISQAGKFGFRYGTTYSATKHAVLGFSKSLLLEVRKHNIRVISVCPGSVETDMIANSPIHENINQVLKPEDVAEVVFSSVNLPNRALVSEIDIRPNNP